MSKTIISNTNICIPEGGDVPNFGNVDVYSGRFDSEIPISINAGDTTFIMCTFFKVTVVSDRVDCCRDCLFIGDNASIYHFPINKEGNDG